jgi:toxin ParE1/3/4
MKIEWRAQALSEFAAILKRIAKDSPSGAARIRTQILHSVSFLEEWPDIGRTGRGGRRELVIAHTRYVVIFKRSRTNVEILRVIHTSRLR